MRPFPVLYFSRDTEDAEINGILSEARFFLPHFVKSNKDFIHMTSKLTSNQNYTLICFYVAFPTETVLLNLRAATNESQKMLNKC